MAPASQDPSGIEPNGTQHGNNGIPSAASTFVNDNLAQALRDVLRGEQAATALEASLTNLESKLDALLAAYEPEADGQAASAQNGEKEDQVPDEKKDASQGQEKE